MEMLALTFDIIGKIIVAYAVLSVHGYVSKDQKIDKAVFLAMKREKMIIIAGIIFMLLGYAIHLYML